MFFWRWDKNTFLRNSFYWYLSESWADPEREQGVWILPNPWLHLDPNYLQVTSYGKSVKSTNHSIQSILFYWHMDNENMNRYNY